MVEAIANLMDWVSLHQPYHFSDRSLTNIQSA
jgi:hypothetical protein